MAKLLICPHCKDIVHLTDVSKSCTCAGVGGARTGNNLYTVWGTGIPLQVNEKRLMAPRGQSTVIYHDSTGIIRLDKKK